jgi:hypothetical protein
MENKETNEKKIEEFYIDDLIKETYTKIAKWHNGDGIETSKESLIALSIELTTEIVGAAFKHFGLTTNLKAKENK